MATSRNQRQHELSPSARAATSQKQPRSAARPAAGDLAQREKELRDFVENAAVALNWIAEDGIILWANSAELSLLGYSAEDYIGHNIAEFHVDETAIHHILERLKRNEKLDAYEALLRSKDGSIRYVSIHSSVYREEGKFIHTRCITLDITQAKRVSELQERVAAIVECSDDAILSEDVNGIIQSWNRGAERIFGYEAQEIIGRNISTLAAPDVMDEIPDILARIRRGERIEHYETKRKTKAGKILAVTISVFPIRDATGLVIGASKIARDTSERERYEQGLREAAALLDRSHADLREREVLLEEIHHRVKNNLQVITSLLGLQARSIKDSATRKKFEESRYRIQAIAILHEILYESASLAEIDFADYIRRLAEHLVRSYGASGRIRMQIHLEPLSCHRDVASPCGLIVNELLSNAFKYAFPGAKSGEVRIELRREPEGRVRLLVGDNGIGLPPDLNWETSPTLGLRLVRTLARQIEANVETYSTNGTVFVMTFLDGLCIK
jgi:PAS domain S-box-containing protein